MDSLHIRTCAGLPAHTSVIYVSTYVSHIHARAHAHTSVHTYVRTYVSMQVPLNFFQVYVIFLWGCLWGLHISQRRSSSDISVLRIYTRAHAHTHTHTRICIYICVCVGHEYTSIYNNAHTHMHTHTRPCAHTHTRTHTLYGEGEPPSDVAVVSSHMLQDR